MIPILFENAFISIQTMWVFVAMAMLMGSYLSIKRLKRKRVDFTLFISHSTKFFIFALICSRVLYFLINKDTYFPAFDLRTLINFVSIWDQGFSFWGAIIGFLFAMAYQLKKAGESFWRWMDALSIPFLIALIIGLFGAFLGGYVYGSPSDLPWAIQYESFNVRYTVPVHPTQIYYILYIIVILFMKSKIDKKTTFFDHEDGNTSMFFIAFYMLGAFALEFLRGDVMISLLGIRLPVFAFAIALAISTIQLIKRIKLYKNESI